MTSSSGRASGEQGALNSKLHLYYGSGGSSPASPSQRSVAFLVAHRLGNRRAISLAAKGSASNPLPSHSARASLRRRSPMSCFHVQQLIHGEVQGDAAEDVDRLPLFVASALRINLPYARATKEIAGIWGGDLCPGLQLCGSTRNHTC